MVTHVSNPSRYCTVVVEGVTVHGKAYPSPHKDGEWIVVVSYPNIPQTVRDALGVQMFGYIQMSLSRNEITFLD